jgi:hypothetical protein
MTIFGSGPAIAVVDDSSDVTCMLRHFIHEIAEHGEDFAVTFNYDPTEQVDFTDLAGSDCHWIHAKYHGDPTLINIDEIAFIREL